MHAASGDGGLASGRDVGGSAGGGFCFIALPADWRRPLRVRLLMQSRGKDGGRPVVIIKVNAQPCGRDEHFVCQQFIKLVSSMGCWLNGSLELYDSQGARYSN